MTQAFAAFPYKYTPERTQAGSIMTDQKRLLPFLAAALFALGPVVSQALQGESVAAALRSGGYVIVMRHASSPRTPPAASAANADNVQLERQLDEAGRASARDMGDALRRLRIPVGEVLSSPTYRALETVRLARLGEPKAHSELGDSGQSMAPESDGKRGTWLRTRAAQSPPPGTNTVIVTHYPNMTEAFPAATQGLADGEALVLRPDGHGSASLVSRVKIEEWQAMTAGP
jgi:phosphohistidine phosphatase SixA